MDVVLIFVSVFLAGVSSLQMELSLLRESSFVLGSTAFTNSFIISIFLGGLAVGAYMGNILVRALGGSARLIFALSQGIAILTILAFVFTKGQYLYGRHEDWQLLCYFGAFTAVPSVIAGMSFSLFLHMLYDHGEKYIAWVYAISTVGNVLSGFMHGMVLVPHFGMPATYFTSAVAAGLALLFVSKFRPPVTAGTTALAAVASAGVLFAPTIPANTRHPIIWSKEDIHGTVQVIDRSEDWKSHDGGLAVDVRIDDRHQCASSARNIEWEFTSVERAMALLDNQGKRVLNAGYCSGASVAKLLEYPSITEIVSIDMNKTVLEVADTFFPEFHRLAVTDERSVIVIDEFRSYLRRLPDDEKFDIILIDISPKDPYYFGLFTREFFTQLESHLADRGVVFWYRRDFLRTGASVFDYLYRARDIGQRFYYFTNFRISKAQRKEFKRVNPNKREGIVYTDHRVYRLAAGELAPEP